MSIQLELVELYDEAINAGYEQSAKTLLSAMKHIETLQEELDRYRNGYQGSCYCCETVGEKNVELLDLLRLAADTIEDETNSYICDCSYKHCSKCKERRYLQEVVAKLREGKDEQ